MKAILMCQGSNFSGCKFKVCTRRVAQPVTCLATDVSLTADPGVANSIPTRSDTFIETDYEINPTVILFPYGELLRRVVVS